MVLRPRTQEHFHPALPVAFPHHTPSKFYKALVVRVWSWVSVSATLGNLLQTQIIKPHPRSGESKEGVEPSNLCFTKPSR